MSQALSKGRLEQLNTMNPIAMMDISKGSLERTGLKASTPQREASHHMSQKQNQRFQL